MQTEFQYPVNPGYKNNTTSREAAAKQKSTLSKNQKLVLEALKAHPEGLTPDEIAAVYGEVFNKFRPRCTELKLLGKITETEIIRPSYLGENMYVVRLKHG